LQVVDVDVPVVSFLIGVFAGFTSSIGGNSGDSELHLIPFLNSEIAPTHTAIANMMITVPMLPPIEVATVVPVFEQPRKLVLHLILRTSVRTFF
jgi:hypothetical protein